MGYKRVAQYQLTELQKLRKNGLSIPEISRQLSIPQTTVTRHVKRVKISDASFRVWKAKRGGSIQRKEAKEKNALEEAKGLLKEVSEREKILFFSALYWGEGSKNDFGLSNTDPNLIAVFVSILRQVFHIQDNQLRVSIRIYEDLDKDSCLQFWSRIVKIPKEEFVNVNIVPGKKKGKLRYGMCRIRVSRSELLLKKIKAIYATFAEIVVPIA